MLSSVAMFDISALWLGLGLGLRHATDADHVAVVSAMIQREPGPLRALRIAVLWGLGHSVSFLTLGLVSVLTGLRVPAAFEHMADLVVAAMLIALGGWHLAGGPGRSAHAVSPARPVMVGLVHGLAGSAGVALLAAATIRSAIGATLYLALFGVGTVIGMALLTAALSWPIAWTTRQSGRISCWIFRAPGVLSIALGVLLGLESWRSLA
jgi:nickel/cobalt exporter